MKDNHSQEFKDNFDNSSHDSLVAFLKQNKVIAPPPAPNFEQQLFAEISKYPQPSSKPSKFHLRRWWLWTLLIPAAIATSLTFNWATNRSQLQVATNPNLAPMSEVEQVAIEQTLISSWNVADESVSQTNSQNSTSDLQILSELSPLEY